jgi:hypothetical protein
MTRYQAHGNKFPSEVAAPTRQVAIESDEITRHLQGRYTSPCEAMWQLFEFPVHDEFPPVIPLAVHLPGKEPIYLPLLGLPIIV